MKCRAHFFVTEIKINHNRTEKSIFYFLLFCLRVFFIFFIPLNSFAVWLIRQYLVEKSIEVAFFPFEVIFEVIKMKIFNKKENPHFVKQLIFRI